MQSNTNVMKTACKAHFDDEGTRGKKIKHQKQNRNIKRELPAKINSVTPRQCAVTVIGKKV